MQPGERFADRFLLEAHAGAGGMGVVFRARDLTTGDVVALKILLRASDAPRFEREARILAGIESPSVVRHVGHGTDASGRQWLAMAWLEGEDLERRLARGPLPWKVAVTLARRLALGLGAAHARGIVHRDVKPTNVMLLDGDPERPVLLDFGIARVEETKHVHTIDGMVLGTPGYLAPEQARGEVAVAPSADVFALGSLLYECVTGRPTFGTGAVMGVLTRILFEPAPHLCAIVEDAPERLDQLVSRMLEKVPGRRPPDGAAVAAELAAIEEGDRADPWNDISIGHSSLALFTVIVAQQLGVREGREAALSALAERFGVRFEPLIDGSIAARVTGAKVATDQALSAVRCALALSETLRPRVVAVATGSALDTGVQIGEVIGRAVDRAVRGGRGVLLDHVTSDLVQKHLELRRDDAGAEVVGPGASGRAAVSRCMGRERELAAIAAAIEASRGGPHAVVIHGEPGIGKSTLIHAAIERAPHVRWWVAANDPEREGAPFSLIAGLLRAAADGASAAEPDEALAEVLGARRSEPSGLFSAGRASPTLFADRVTQGLVDRIASVCASGPLGIVLEDVHGADTPSIDAIDSLQRRLEHAPLVVIAAAREEIAERTPPLFSERRVTRIALGPLDRGDAMALARERLGPGAAPGTVEAVVGRAEGHPFFLAELARAARSGSRELPGSVQAMLQARFEALSTLARRALRAASVLGDRIDLDAVRAIAAGTGPPELSTLVEEEMLVADGSAWRFRNPMIREVAYATLTEADRALAHKLAAQWLGAKQRASAVVIAEHWLRAGDAEHAASACASAAEEALAANDLARTLQYAERGLAQRPKGLLRGSLLLSFAEASLWKGHLTDAHKASERARKALPLGSAAWCAAAAASCAAAGRMGDRPTLAAVAAELEAVAPDAENARDLGVALARGAVNLFFVGESELGRRATEALAAIEAAASGDAWVSARLAQTRAVQARYSGDPLGHLRHTEAALAAFEELGDVRTGCVMRANLGDAWREIGQDGEAEACLRAAVSLAVEHGIASVALPATMNLGLVLLRTDRASEARALFEDAIADSGRSGDRRLESVGRIYLAQALLASGAIDDARNEVDAATALLDERSPYLPLALAVESEARRAGGDVPGALRCAEDAVERLTELGGHAEEGELTVILALCAAREANRQHAGALYALGVAKKRLAHTLRGITDGALRADYLANVPEARRIESLCRAWGVA